MSIVKSSQHPVLGFLTVISDPQFGLLGGYLVLNWAGRPLEFHCTAPIKPNRAQQILYGPTLEPYLYGEQIGRVLVSKTQHNPFLICTDVAPALALRPYVDWPMVWMCPSPLLHSASSKEYSSGGGLTDCRSVDFPLQGGKSEEPSRDLNSPYFSGNVSSYSDGHLGERAFSDTPASIKQAELTRSGAWRLNPPHPGIGPLVVFCWRKHNLAVLENLPQDYHQVQEALAGLDESFDLAEPFGRIRDAIEEARRGG
ncbi:MAG: hypothetical protein NZ602_16435 [Thermoguttaceae bacterium]|nr:hypothetical protein [Thermoguttaceae bacterium]MDW8039175.1 hypothetical protein [Thermoguttaceae bacterium]